STTVFMSSPSVFVDALSQMTKTAGAPAAAIGGTNPAQVGLGVRSAAIVTNFGQGTAQATGRSTDLMINGDGFFTVRSGSESLYSRAGAFAFDANGTLVNPDGLALQGWNAVNGVINNNAAPADITLPIGSLLPPAATANMTVIGNLPADTTNVNPITTSIQGYDSQGNAVSLSATFAKTSATTWDLTLDDGTNTTGPTSVSFNPDGTVPNPTTFTVGAVNVDLSSVTNFAGASTVQASSQDGSAAGSLQSFSIGGDGVLTGVYSNGLKQNLGQVAVATFNNAPGLEKSGGSTYRSTVNSGLAQLGVAGSTGRGTLQAGSLEMSNVDLAQEFTNLIIAQRGFQANSKVISTSDELLQALIELKR
ncbi:MAG: flagellar hook protein FlgE, partial [Micromonosporaceae bacterium]|nr:flagellar hook protein FlgE [Micromonosporaceae bacterium]